MFRAVSKQVFISVTIAAMAEEKKRKRDCDGEQPAAKQLKSEHSVHEQFVRWMDERCAECWNELFSAGTWSGVFKKIYTNDQNLETIVKIRDKDGLEAIKTQLKEQVGPGIGAVVGDVVTKLDGLFSRDSTGGLSAV